jgi:hypothetical protein
MSSPALAAPPAATAATTAGIAESSVQQFSTTTGVGTLALDGNTAGTISITVNDGATGSYGVDSSSLTVGSSLTNTNTASSAGFVNDATKAITVTLNNATSTLGLSSVSGQTSPSASSSVGDVAIAISQETDLADATVSTTVDMGITTDGVDSSTLKMIGNTQKATGSLNSDSATITLALNNSGAGTTEGASSGIAIAQTANASDLEVTTHSLDSVSIDNGTAGIDLLDSTVTLTNNTQSAVGVGNSSTNTQTVTANYLNSGDITTTGVGPTLATVAPAQASLANGAAAIGGVATASQQDLAGTASTLTASVAGVTGEAAGSAGFQVSVANTVDTSTINNNLNGAYATIRGNEVSNNTTLTANDISSGSLASSGNAAAIASQQNVTAYTITAGAMGDNGTAVYNLIGTDVDASQVTASSNTVSADAVGNRGANHIVASATTIDTSGSTAGSASVLSGLAAATGGFAVASSQTVDSASEVNALLVNALSGATSSASIETEIGNSVVDSTVQSNSNRLLASATGNMIMSGTNSVVLSGTNLNTTASVANFQSEAGDVNAIIGAGAVAGSAGTAAAPFDVAGTVTAGVWSSNILSLSVDQKAAFIAQYSGTAGWTYSAVTGAVEFTSIGSGALTLSSTVAGTPGTLASAGDGGVTITVANDITNSSLTVDSNVVAGSATGNSAVNRVAVDGTNLGAGDVLAEAKADPTDTTAGVLAQGENVLSNLQEVGATATLTSQVSSQYAIITEGAGAAASGAVSDVTDSTLSVSGNVQSASTTGNSATNTLAETGTNLTTNGALMSAQTVGAATIQASSTATVAAPAANTDSTLQLDNNSNTATAIANTATNTFTAAADNTLAASDLSTSRHVALTGDGASDYVAIGDNVLNNAQTTGATVTAAATTNVWNNDGGATGASAFATDGINASTVDLSGNSTLASASANRSVNTLNISANTVAANAGVLNQQLSTGAVDATATSAFQVTVGGFAPTAIPVDSSLVTLANNSTTARAGGNTASNALNASGVDFNPSVSAGYQFQDSDPTSGDYVRASFAVLNEQRNSGAITAVANVTYGASFAALGTADAVNNSGVALNGNTSTAVAYGNAATNAITLVALNTNNLSTAIGSEQINNGPISATSQAAFAISATGAAGGVLGSSLGINGSSMGASAFGNSVTSTTVFSANNVGF